VTWVPYNTISLINNQHVYVHEEIEAWMANINPFDKNSLTLHDYTGSYRNFGPNLHKLIRIIAMDYRFEQETFNPEIVYKRNYYLVEIESGEIGWVRPKHLLHERFKPALAIGLIFQPLRNLFVLGGNGSDQSRSIYSGNRSGIG